MHSCFVVAYLWTLLDSSVEYQSYAQNILHLCTMFSGVINSSWMRYILMWLSFLTVVCQVCVNAFLCVFWQVLIKAFPSSVGYPSECPVHQQLIGKILCRYESWAFALKPLSKIKTCHCHWPSETGPCFHTNIFVTKCMQKICQMLPVTLKMVVMVGEDDESGDSVVVLVLLSQNEEEL